jgi:site-specific DNA recombinase
MKLVLDEIRAAGRGPAPEEAGQPSEADLVAGALERVVVRRGAIEIVLKEAEQTGPQTRVVAWSPPPSRRRRAVVGVPDQVRARPIRSETRARLVEGIAKARAWADELVTGRVRDTGALAAREGCSERSVRQTLNLAFLAPELVQAAVEGRLPDGLGITRLIELPLDWNAQRRMIFQRPGELLSS